MELLKTRIVRRYKPTSNMHSAHITFTIRGWDKKSATGEGRAFIIAFKNGSYSALPLLVTKFR